MSKINKDLDNMAGVEPRSYKKFSSIIMTKEMIVGLRSSLLLLIVIS
jgi:hypothetical protein